MTRPNQKWSYGVRVVGVRKRCRRVDIHVQSRLANVPPGNDPDQETAKQIAIQWINKNMKSYSKACALATLWTDEGGIETWQPFTKEHNLEFPL